MNELRIGIDIGKRHDPSAIMVVITEFREVDGKKVAHYNVPLPKRLELDTPYPAQVEELARICRGAVKRFNESKRSSFMKQPRIFVDVTGVGDAVVDLLAPELKNVGILHPCRFVAGDRLSEGKNAREYVIGKSHFVSRLQVLSESRVVHLPQNYPEAEQLAKEMLDFDIDVDETSGKATYGAIRPGTHDDMVCALGLACLLDPEQPIGKLTFVGGKRVPPWKQSGSGPGGQSWLSEAAAHHGGNGANFVGGINHR